LSYNLPEFYGWLKSEPNGKWRLVCQGDVREWVEEALRKLQAPGKWYSAVCLPSPETPYKEVMFLRKRAK
jgi:hypothetical protein